jgi:hypothetical protein
MNLTRDVLENLCGSRNGKDAPVLAAKPDYTTKPQV